MCDSVLPHFAVCADERCRPQCCHAVQVVEEYYRVALYCHDVQFVLKQEREALSYHCCAVYIGVRHVVRLCITKPLCNAMYKGVRHAVRLCLTILCACSV